ncbi:hypothetical protein HZS55_03170 [Halosimplex rubrum]|uniref:Uncharacterized protein n=1 Tax=Halosimplex rubrum TaxID=869889 RepID=A0A7D5P2C8_9EURY|nr:hypothetical protein [Halosimplex rubrum]QLH76364.1 hypothetical protein HZS55_03170 [Halosimplex rubrum]
MVALTGLFVVGIGLYVAYVAPAVAARAGSAVEGRGSFGADVAAVRLVDGTVAVYGVCVVISG